MRKQSRGRSSPQAVNIFKGLLFNPLDGGSYFVMRKRGRKGPIPLLVNGKGWQGQGSSSSFHYGVFEYVILSQLREIPWRQLTEDANAAERLETLTNQRDKKARRKKEIFEAIVNEEESSVASLNQAHDRLIAEIEELNKEIANERRRVEAKNAEEWREGMSIADKLLRNPEDAALRRKLHAILRRHLEGIWLICGGIASSRARFCCAQVFFKDSATVRTYSMWHQPSHVIGKYRIERGESFAFRTEKPVLPGSLKNASAARELHQGYRGILPAERLWRPYPPAIETTP